MYDCLGDTFRFNVESRTWECLAVAQPVAPRAYFSATVVNGHIWVVGGSSVDKVVADVSAWDIAAGTWRTVPVKGDAGLLCRCAHAAVAHPKKPGHIILFGGISRDGSFLGDLVELRCSTSGASVAAITPRGAVLPRAYHSMSSLGHRCFVFGGRDSQAGLCSSGDLAAVYDSAQNSWVRLGQEGEVPCARSSHRTAVVGGAIWLFGGAAMASGRVQRLSDLYSCTHSNGTAVWRRHESGSGAAWPPDRAAHAMVSVAGRLLVVGGYSGDSTYPGDAWMCRLVGDKPTPEKPPAQQRLTPPAKCGSRTTSRESLSGSGRSSSAGARSSSTRRPPPRLRRGGGRRVSAEP